MKYLAKVCLLTAVLGFTACTGGTNETMAQTMNQMYITIDGEATLTVRLAQNSSVDALVAALQQGDITYEAHDYGGFEKVGDLGRSFPQNNTQIDTRAGDVILYQGSNLCLYYGENVWSFTRIGWIEGVTQAELKQALKAGQGDVTITLSLSQKTAIGSVRADSAKDAVYSLNGLRVNNTTKGVYIKKGKKVIL